MYDCLKEVLQTEAKLERFELEAAITGTCEPPCWVIRHSIESSWRDLYKFRGSWGEEGKEHGYCVSNLFQSCSVLVSLHSFYRLASIYIWLFGCVCFDVESKWLRWLAEMMIMMMAMMLCVTFCFFVDPSVFDPTPPSSFF